MALSAIAMMQEAERRNSTPDPECHCPTCGHAIEGRDGVSLSDATGLALIFGREVKFSVSEGRVLRALMETYPNVARYDWLKNYVYGADADQRYAKTVQVHACRVRQKLEGTGGQIITHWAHGLRLAFDRPANVKKLGRRAGRAA